MKKKKLLSLALILAFIVTMIPWSSASAAGDYIFIKGEKKALTEKSVRNLYVGGKRINLDYKINGKTTGGGGSWRSSDRTVAAISQKGSCVAKNNGTTVISYTYKKNGATAKLSFTLKVGTKPSSVTLRPSNGTDLPSKVVMKPNIPMKFIATIIPNPKAVAVTPSIQSTYTVYYELFADADCTKKADAAIATMSADGVVIPLKESTIYMRAQARSTQASTVGNVNSNVLTLVIGTDATIVQSGSNTFNVTAEGAVTLGSVVNKKTGRTINAVISYPNAADRTNAVITTNSNLTADEYIVSVFIDANNTKSETILCQTAAPSKIEITSSMAALDKPGADASGYPNALVYYKLYDQFGNDITNNTYLNMGSISAVCQGTGNTTAIGDTSERGTIKIPMSGNIMIGSSIKVSLYFTGTVNNVSVLLQDEANLTISLPNQIKSIEFKGIYTFDYLTNYVKCADEYSSTILAGKVINDFGSVSANNKTPGAYYLLLKVTDTNGNLINQSGVKQTTIGTYVKGSSGLELDTVLVNGSEVIQSIDGIVIDGVKYLTYPLKATTLKDGSTDFVVSSNYGTPVVKTFTLTIATTLDIASFEVFSTSKLYAGEFGYLDYAVKNTNGNLITDYDTLTTMTKATNAGKLSFIPETVVKSDCSSTFQWEKQDDGTAKLKYLPSMMALLKNGSLSSVGQDLITTFPGTTKTRVNSIIVYSLDLKNN